MFKELFSNFFAKLIISKNEDKFNNFLENLPNTDPELNRRIVSSSQKLKAQLLEFEKQYANNPEVLKMIQNQLKNLWIISIEEWMSNEYFYIHELLFEFFIPKDRK